MDEEWSSDKKRLIELLGILEYYDLVDCYCRIYLENTDQCWLPGLHIVLELQDSHYKPSFRCFLRRRPLYVDDGFWSYDKSLTRSCFAFKMPEWTIKNHDLYPLHIQNIVFTCLCVFNKLNTTINARISKDIRLLLIKYVARNWEKQLLKN